MLLVGTAIFSGSIYALVLLDQVRPDRQRQKWGEEFSRWCDVDCVPYERKTG